MRNAHGGASSHWLPATFYDKESCGGGAMMDLGAHGMYMANWLLGEPVRIQSMFNNYTDVPVEDNSICTIEFANKALAIAETSLVSPFTPVMLEVYGTKGVILCVNDDVKFQTADTAKLVDGGWVKAKLPQALPHPIRQFIDSVLYDKEIIFGTKEARTLTDMMEKAYIAYAEKREVSF